MTLDQLFCFFFFYFVSAVCKIQCYMAWLSSCVWSFIIGLHHSVLFLLSKVFVVLHFSSVIFFSFRSTQTVK